MGRGLSPLQTTILGLASHNEGPGCSLDGILTTREVYMAVYGWEQTFLPSHACQAAEWWGRHVWDVQAIGQATYNRGAATVSRAIRRLVARGFLRPFASVRGPRPEAWVLTTAGKALVEQLSVKKAQGTHDS